MRLAVLQRLRALEQRLAPRDGERTFRFPDWLLNSWKEQGVPIDEFGRPDYGAMERIGAEQRAAAGSIKAGTETSRAPDLTQAIKAGSRFD
jgi:hypothetical protein